MLYLFLLCFYLSVHLALFVSFSHNIPPPPPPAPTSLSPSLTISLSLSLSFFLFRNISRFFSVVSFSLVSFFFFSPPLLPPLKNLDVRVTRELHKTIYLSLILLRTVVCCNEIKNTNSMSQRDYPIALNLKMRSYV